jgi:hypothetical protein
MEAAATAEDQKDDAKNDSSDDAKKDDSKLSKREINWEVSTHLYGRWD